MRCLSVFVLLIAGLTYASDYNFHILNQPDAPVSITTGQCSNSQLLLGISIRNTSDDRIKSVDIHAVAISPKKKVIRGGFGFRVNLGLDPQKENYFERYDADWEKIAVAGDDIVIYITSIEADDISWKSEKHKEKSWQDTLRSVAAAPCVPGVKQQ